MDDPLTHGFRNLTRFSGRDRRGLFWPHATIVFVMVFLVMGVSMTIVMAQLFGELQSFAAANPQAAEVQSSPGQYSIEIEPTYPGTPVPNFTLFFVIMSVGVALAVFLLAAAVSRRLHDTGRTAWWGAVPPFLLGIGLCLFPLVMRDFMTAATPNFTLFGVLMIGSFTYNATLIGLIIVLALPGAPGPNRYGPAT